MPSNKLPAALTNNASYYDEDFNNIAEPHKSFKAIEFEECCFTECDFNNAVFDHCRFIECQFVNCNISLLKLPFTSFENVVFEDCKIVGVDWTRVSWSNLLSSSPVRFYRSNLNDNSFYGLKLKKLTLNDCKANEIDFREGDFNCASFTNSDFDGSLFSQTDLTGADLTGAKNYHIDLLNNKMKGAKLCRYEAVNLLESIGIILV